jgi:hypothetical protein
MGILAKQSSTADFHDRVLKEAFAASIRQCQALEDMKRRTRARWHAFKYSCTSTCARGCSWLCEPDGVWVSRGPEAPMFSGSTKVQKSKFMDQYEAYAQETFANAQPGGTQIHMVPLSACIGPLSIECSAYWEIGKNARDISEDDWKDYFLASRDCDPIDLMKLDTAVAKLKMNVALASAESRVSKLVSDFESVLVKLYMEGFAGAEPKKTVEHLIVTIMPVSLRNRVKERLKLSENRHLKKDGRGFKLWLAHYMKLYGEFEPLMAATPSVPKPVPATKATHKAKVDEVRGKATRSELLFWPSWRPRCQRAILHNVTVTNACVLSASETSRMSSSVRRWPKARRSYCLTEPRKSGRRRRPMRWPKQPRRHHRQRRIQ